MHTYNKSMQKMHCFFNLSVLFFRDFCYNISHVLRIDFQSLRKGEQMMKRNIVLVGMMGSGKSHIGRKLARRLKWQFVDTDRRLERSVGMSIAEFFSEMGEEAFRQVESEVLADLLQRNQVVSTGGGVVLSQKNRDLLKTNTDNIYLKADFETLYQRIAADRDNQRPLFLNNSKEELAAIFQERQAWYEEVASLILDVTKLSPEEIIEELR